MSEILEQQVNLPATILTNDVSQPNSTDTCQSILNKILNNKTYIGIGIAVIILGAVVYYFFIKNKKAIVKETNQNIKLELPKNQKVVEPLNNLSQDYFVLDANGNPVRVSSGLPIPLQQPSTNELMMLQKQLQEKKLYEQQMLAQSQTITKQKLEHPPTMESEENLSEELNRIKANEDQNIAELNLTNSELAEITKKLEMMNSDN